MRKHTFSVVSVLPLISLSTMSCSPSADTENAAVEPENVVVYEVAPLENIAAGQKFDDFASFKKTVYKEPFEGGVYIVNGDTPVVDDTELEEFYSKVGALKFESVATGALVFDAPGGNIAGWTDGKQKALVYCVSKTFGSRYNAVVADMRNAASAWEADANVKFIHAPEQDGSCDARNENVVFDVRPVNTGQYLARAFFPRYGRINRNVLIDNSSFTLDPSGKIQLVGILRHELAHVLGFRHEHTRPEAGKCYEDKDWVPLTSYDGYSVTHYPQCNGDGDWSLTLTDADRLGAACFYGKTPNSKIDEKQCFPLTARFEQPNALPYSADLSAQK